MNRFTLLFLLSLFAVSQATLGFVGNMFPIGGGTTNLVIGSSVTVYVQVYKQGVTDNPNSQGAGISCYLLGNFTGNLIRMRYNSFFTANPNNDEYQGDINSTMTGYGYFTYTSFCVDETDNTTTYQNSAPAGVRVSPPPTTALPTTAVPTTAQPTTAVPTTAVPTTAVPTTAVPTTAIPTTGVPIIPCSRLGMRADCKDIICGYYNTFAPKIDYIPSNDGVASLNVLPRNYSKVLVYLLKGITGYPYDNTTATLDGTSFEFWVDAGEFAGRAVQLIITYDWTGDGSWDRTETFPFFACDPLTSFELYKTSVRGITPHARATVVGDNYSPFFNGKIRIEFWAALADPTGSGPISIRTDTVISGQLSSITIPYVVNYWTEPLSGGNGCTYPNPTTGVATTGVATTGQALPPTTVPSRSIGVPSDGVSGSPIQTVSILTLGLIVSILALM